MTNKEALEKIKQTCLDHVKDCDKCPIDKFCYTTWPLTFPEDWDTDLIKEGE